MIILLTSSFPRYDGDLSGNFILELAKRLSVEYDISIICPHSDGCKFYEKIWGVTVTRFPYFFPLKLQRLYTDGGIPYNFQRSKLAKIQSPFFMTLELIFTALKIYKCNIKLVNSHWLIPQGIVGSICRIVFNTKHILTIHSSEITTLRNIPFGNKIAEFCFKNSDVIISVSNHRLNSALDLISKELHEEIISKSFIMPMGINISSFELDELNKPIMFDSGDSQFNILFIGRLIEVKGCEYLIRSIELIVEIIPNVKLIIVGDGPLESQLKQLTNKLKLERHIIFKGYVNYDNIPRYFFQSDIVAFPSIVDESGFEEGLPVVLIEAMAAGKATIATRTNGVLEVIKDRQNGLIVDPKSPEQFAEMIKLLYVDKDFRKKLEVNAQETAKKYDWDVVTTFYLNIIRTLEST